MLAKHYLFRDFKGQSGHSQNWTPYNRHYGELARLAGQENWRGRIMLKKFQPGALVSARAGDNSLFDERVLSTRPLGNSQPQPMHPHMRDQVILTKTNCMQLELMFDIEVHQ